MSLYEDSWITCDDDAISVRGYYFPWGTKKIPYRSIRSLRRVELSAARGRARVWGTSNPRYWANLDPGRPRKREGLIIDLGRAVSPLITPDDVDAVETIIQDHVPDAEISREPKRGPII